MLKRLVVTEEAAAVQGRGITPHVQRRPLPVCTPMPEQQEADAQEYRKPAFLRDFSMPEQRLPQLLRYAIIFRLKIKGAGDNELHRF